MNPDTIIEIFRHLLFIVAITIAAIAIPGLIVGLVISVLQAATQINESTLSFLPKLFVMLLAIVLLAPFLFGLLTDYTRDLVLNIPHWLG